MKKISALIILFLVAVYCFYPKNIRPQQVTVLPETERTIATAPTPAAPASLPEQKDFTVKKPIARQDREKIIRRISPSLKDSFEQDPSINITRGHVFISNMGAVAKENYQSSMGDILYQDGTFNYVRANGSKTLLPVAMSPSTGKLHPISSVLHVLEATPAIRNEVKGLGLTEYYYHPGLKLLSLKSSPGEVMQAYSDLKDRGFDVQLEVIKPHQQGI